MVMTIDEAIICTRAKAIEKFLEAKEIFKWQKEHEELYENAREYEQIAKWLEELKARREITDDIEKSNFNPKMLKACTNTSYDCGYQQGNADAIEKIIELAHEDAATGNMVINLVDVEKLKNSKEKTDDKRL